MSAFSTADWLGIGVVALLMLVLVGGLRFVQVRTRLATESIRKLFHIGSGGVSLALPWLFDSIGPVILLGTASLAAFVLLRIVPMAREGAGQVLQAVERKTVGEFWFILGVVTIFAVTGGNPVNYSIGILILAVADSAAALIGVFYGKHRYSTLGGIKSAEGSVAFFLVAFLCVHVPLLLFTEVGRLESLLTAVNIALVLTLAEADASRGSDNFVLPVLVVVLLDVYLGDTRLELIRDLAVILALTALVFVYRHRVTLSTDALIAAALGGYVIWLFGDLRWLVAPVVLFASYTWLVGRPRLPESQSLHADVVLAVMAPGIAIVTIYKVTGLDSLYMIYAAIWAANLAVIGTLHRQLEQPELLVRHFAVKNSAIAMLVLVPGILAGGRYFFNELLSACATILLSVTIFGLIGRTLKVDPTRLGSWWRVTASVSLGALLGFGLFQDL